MVSAYDELPRTPANFVALSPLRYLERAAYIYPHRAYRDWETDRKSTRLNSSHITRSRMPSSA